MLQTDFTVINQIQQYAEHLYKILKKYPNKETVDVKAAAVRAVTSAAVLATVTTPQSRTVYKKKMIEMCESTILQTEKFFHTHDDIDKGDIENYIEVIRRICKPE